MIKYYPTFYLTDNWTLSIQTKKLHLIFCFLFRYAWVVCSFYNVKTSTCRPAGLYCCTHLWAHLAITSYNSRPIRRSWNCLLEIYSTSVAVHLQSV